MKQVYSKNFSNLPTTKTTFTSEKKIKVVVVLKLGGVCPKWWIDQL